MTELEEFSALLEERERGYWENWQRLNAEGDELNGYVTVATEIVDERRWHRSCAVVTQSPTGKLYRWYYDECYTGEGDDVRNFTEVVEVEKKMVEVATYEEIK